MDLQISTTQSVWIALGLVVVLAALHLGAPHIRKLPLVPERSTASFAGGLAVAYVFLHLLPEIAEGNEAVGEALSDVLEPTPMLELAIFLVALAGFTVFYGLERLARRHGSDTAGGGGSLGVYWLHLGSFLVYNGLITYSMALRVRTGLLFAVLFTVAMGLHFVLTDRGLEEHYPHRFRATGRILLAAALLTGWVLGAIAAPTSTLLVSLLTALLGGPSCSMCSRKRFLQTAVPASDGSASAWFSTPACWLSSRRCKAERSPRTLVRSLRAVLGGFLPLTQHRGQHEALGRFVSPLRAGGNGRSSELSTRATPRVR